MPQSLSRQLVTHKESGLGVIEYSEVVAALNEKKPSKKRVQFTEEQRFEIGKYAAVNRATNAVKQFKNTDSRLTFSESTARKLRHRYNDITKQKRVVDNKMPRLKLGRPLFFGVVLDEKVKHFLLQLRKKGGVVNTAHLFFFKNNPILTLVPKII